MIEATRRSVAANLRHRETEELYRARKRLERRTDFKDAVDVLVHMGTVLAIGDEIERRAEA